MRRKVAEARYFQSLLLVLSGVLFDLIGVLSLESVDFCLIMLKTNALGSGLSWKGSNVISLLDWLHIGLRAYGSDSLEQ
jgi:hypothetical protein